MDRLVVWSHAAADDFEAIASYLARDSPAYASAFASEVWEASQSLATLSERGRLVRELGQPDLREIYIRRYRLIYRVEAERVAILALIHGRRDLPSAWEERER